MIWYYPWVFFLLILVPALVAWYYFRQRHPDTTLVLPSASQFKPLVSRWKLWLRHLPFVLRIAAVVLLIIAIARPRIPIDEQRVTTEGIDLVIALDISSSMLAEDLEPRNRLLAAKKVAKEFIQGRSSDRIGLVMFSGEAFTWCPLTLDYDVLTELMDQIEPGVVQDGTAIGKAIATGANRLRSGEAESKVLILLTDGVNNVDQPDPLTAALAAGELGIKIYTIGVGSWGQALAPVQMANGQVRMQMVQVEIDEDLLRQVAARTGGQYFRATSTEALRDIYQRIDQLEKTEVEIEHLRRWRERFYLWASLALAILAIERTLSMTWLRNAVS